MPSALERASRFALDLLYPPQCALCRRPGLMVCGLCAALLPPADGARCERCWRALEGAGPCSYCRSKRLRFASVRAAFVMDEGARRLVHLLKYDNLSALAEPMAALMAERIALAEHIDVVVPVPLHGGRHRSRGYNQAELLARHFAARTGARFDAGAARRIRATRPLASTMHADERWQIMEGAFRGRLERAVGARILLVDDVTTTGATLDACAGALLDAGAARVDCVTFARAD